MKVLMTLILLVNSPANTIDFGLNKQTNWYSLNDGVMGGRSIGKLSFEEDVMVFKGSVSFDNNGGFASVRSRYANRDLSEFKTVEIRYRSENQSIGYSLENHRAWWLPVYKAVLPATDMEWKTIKLDLRDFKEYRIGRKTGRTVGNQQLANVIRTGFITNDKKEGRFIFEVDYIRFE